MKQISKIIIAITIFLLSYAWTNATILTDEDLFDFFIAWEINFEELIFLLEDEWETDAEFEIIATCWIGDKHAIAEILNLSEIHIHTLKRLSRDQMVEVIAGAGIQGVNWLMREIVTQAEGLPGLAVYDDPRKWDHKLRWIIEV